MSNQAPLMSPRSSMLTTPQNSSTNVCQIMAIPKPLARFNTSRQVASNSVEAAKSSVASHRIYIDEGSDDLVIIGDGEVMFHRIALAKEKEAGEQDVSSVNSRTGPGHSLRTPLGSMASKPSNNTLDRQHSEAPSVSSPRDNGDGGVANTVHLRTARKKNIRFAKRCPAPTASKHHHPSYMVAVVHDDINVDIYLPMAARLDKPRWVGSTDTNQTELTDSFAVWQTKPNNLRFGSKPYPIRSIAWSVGPDPTNSSTTTGSNDFSQLSFGSNSSNQPVSLAVNYVKYLIVLSEISVDLVQVSDRPGTDPLVLAKRIVTKVDYWSFDFRSHVFALVNKAKMNIVKPFVADRANVVRALPQIKLSDVAELTTNPVATSMMDAPSLAIIVQPLTISGKLYIAHFNMKHELVLYRWVPEQGNRNVTDESGNAAGAASDSSHVSVDTANQSLVAGGNLLPTGAGVGSFEKAYTLGLYESGGFVRLQVLDNLLITHWPSCSVSTAFDLTMMDTLATTATKYAGSPLTRHVDPTVSAGSPAPAMGGSPASRSSGGWRERLRASTTMTKPSNSFNTSDAQSGSGQFYRSPTDVLRPTTMVGPMFANHEAGGVSTSPERTAEETADATTSAALCVPEDDRGYGLLPDGEMSSEEFYNGSLPLVLDRRHGKVSLLCIDSSAMASSIKDLCGKTQFLLNRCEGGGSAVPRMLYRLLVEQEPLGSISQLFDIVAEESSRLHKLHKAQPNTTRRGLPYGLPAHQSRSLIGAAKDIAPILPLLHEEEDVRAAEEGALLGFDGAMRYMVPRNAQKDQGWVGRGYVDQQSLYHFVFYPLSQKAFREPSTQQAEGSSPGQNSEQRGQTMFARYFLAALVEYARALVHRGLRLSDALQQLMLHAFVQGPEPDHFKLHQMIMYRAVEDHVATAQRLMRMQQSYPPAFQLGLDMLSRLDKPHLIVDEFLAHNEVLRAAKFIAENRLKNAAVVRVLSRASDQMDITAMQYATATDEHGKSSVEAKTARQASEKAVVVYCTVYQLLSRHMKTIGENIEGMALMARRYQDVCTRGL